MADRLYQVKARYFTAGFVVSNGRVIECAPILRKWIKRLSEDQALDVCEQRGWKVSGQRAK